MMQCVRTGAQLFIQPLNKWVLADVHCSTDGTLLVQWNRNSESGEAHRNSLNYTVLNYYKLYTGMELGSKIMICNKSQYWNFGYVGKDAKDVDSSDYQVD
jgi:hypothetical protein